jgi:hypothetical protein
VPKTVIVHQALRRPLTRQKASSTRRYDVNVAVLCGIPGAVLFQSFVNWCSYSAVKGRFKAKGIFWTYRSVKDACKRHPEMSSRMVYEAIQDLKRLRLIQAEKDLFQVAGHHNITWYSLGPRAGQHLSQKAAIIHGQTDFCLQENETMTWLARASVPA